jgi:hypothetical protein
VLLQFYSQQTAAKGSWRLGEREGKKPVMHIITLKEEVQLQQTENAWKPGRMKPPTTNEQEAKTEVCFWHFQPQDFGSSEYCCVYPNAR